MDSNIFIPNKIKVGYQNRKDTYTNNLAYIIYYDETNKLRKEKSWQNWRNKSIEPNDFENIPTEGFVLNKNVGGYKSYFGIRQAYIRIYDPRGFEFEITLPNLLFILENCSSLKGKGLVGEFVYAWSGTDLWLIPTCSPEFNKIKEFSDNIFSPKKIITKDLNLGAKYKFKNGNEYIYLGKFETYRTGYPEFLQGTLDAKYFYFIKIKKDNNPYSYKKRNEEKIYYFFEKYKSLPKIVECTDEKPHPMYANLVDELNKLDSINPKNKKKIVGEPYTLKEFEEDIKLHLRKQAVNKNSLYYDGYFYFIKGKDIIDSIRTSVFGYSTSTNLNLVYGNRGTHMSVEEIFEKFKPKKIKILSI